MNLTKRSAWTLGTAGLCVAISASSWFLVIDPERAEAAESRQQTVVTQDSNAALELKIEQLRLQYADLPARQAELAAVRAALPEEPALAQLIRELQSAAQDAGLTLDSVNAGSVSVVVVDDTAVTAVPEAEPSAEPSAEATTGTDAADGSGTAADTGTDPSGDAAGPHAVATVPTGPVLASVPITVTTTGDFAQTSLFLKNVQVGMTRALLVDALTLDVVEASDDVEAGTIAGNLSGRVFVFVDPTRLETAGDASQPAAIG